MNFLIIMILEFGKIKTFWKIVIENSIFYKKIGRKFSRSIFVKNVLKN